MPELPALHRGPLKPTVGCMGLEQECGGQEPPVRPLSQGCSMPWGSQQWFCLICFWNKAKHLHKPHLFHKYSPAMWTHLPESDQAAKHSPLFMSQSPKLGSQNLAEGDSGASCSVHWLQLGGINFRPAEYSRHLIFDG